MSVLKGNGFLDVRNINLKGGARGSGILRFAPKANAFSNGGNWSSNPFDATDYGLYIDSSGNLVYSSLSVPFTFGPGGIGYGTGAGGAVTQATNRTTAVTLSKLSGTITTSTASLAAEAAAEFTVTNTLVAIGDTIVLSQQSGSNGGNTDVLVSGVAAGSFKIKVANNNAAAGTAETGAILINYAVIKAVSA